MNRKVLKIMAKDAIRNLFLLSLGLFMLLTTASLLFVLGNIASAQFGGQIIDLPVWAYYLAAIWVLVVPTTLGWLWYNDAKDRATEP